MCTQAAFTLFIIWLLISINMIVPPAFCKTVVEVTCDTKYCMLPIICLGCLGGTWTKTTQFFWAAVNQKAILWVSLCSLWRRQCQVCFRLAGFNFGLMYIGKNKKKIKTNFSALIRMNVIWAYWLYIRTLFACVNPAFRTFKQRVRGRFTLLYWH